MGETQLKEIYTCVGLFVAAGEMDSSFDLERWEFALIPQRYGLLLLGFYSGVATRRIVPTIFFLVAWNALIQFYNSIENLYENCV